MNKKIFLHDNWQFALQTKVKKNDNIKYKKWYPAKVPGTVYHNLLINNLIPDPFYADNELKLQWIAESDWNYRTTFNRPEGFKREEPLYLVFEGIDTIAEVYLNDNKIGSADNMFCSYKYEVSKHIEKKNKLEVIFASPYKYAKELEKKYGQLRVALNSERAYIRKAQYSFGWDWGPSFADIGLWKPVYLLQEQNNAIQSLTFNTISLEGTKAKLELNINFKNELSGRNKIIANIDDDIKESRFIIEHSGGKSIKSIIEVDNPELWWPNGEGKQPLSTCSINPIDACFLMMLN